LKRRTVVVRDVRVALVLLLVGMALGVGRDGAAAEGPRLLTFIEADQLEYRALDGDDTVTWNAHGWIGGDDHKAWIKSEGTAVVNGAAAQSEWQLLYSRAVTAFWDVQVGARYDVKPDPSRGYVVVGVQGLAPYFFDVDAAAFLSDDGDVSARIEAGYEWLLTQRLIAQPSVEVNGAVQDVEELGIGSGLGDVELGLRFRYEIVREVAPYVGLVWERTFGPTADLARRRGADVNDTAVVAGIRLWF
jgi:copper resistance protein B